MLVICERVPIQINKEEKNSKNREVVKRIDINEKKRNHPEFSKIVVSKRKKKSSFDYFFLSSCLFNFFSFYVQGL
jgi:hypothetical protein